MNMAEWLAASAHLRPDAPALLTGSRVDADYLTFARRAAAVGAHLAKKYGVAPGDRVALFMTNCTAYFECLYGIWWVGAAAVPINAKLHGREAAWICENAGAKLLFVCDDTADHWAEADTPSLATFSVDGDDYRSARDGEGAAAPLPRETDDLAWLFYTSGTTGRPKGVMLSHGNLLAMSMCYFADVDQPSPEDAALYAAPISHGAGLYNFPNVRVGARHVVPESGGFEADEVLALGKQLRNVSMFAAPTMIKRMVEAPADLPRDKLRTIVWGGAPMYVEDAMKALDRFGPCLAQIYGQGESPMTITVLPRAEVADRDHPRWRERLASAGRPFRCVDVRIAGAEDRTLPAGESGEILVRGDVVMRGYWQNDAASAAALKGGYLHTGDVGAFDPDGYLALKDRSKDLIISGGSNIYPREVEEILLQHGGVREVSVIGRPDPEWGEAVVAYVVGDAPRAELDALCLAHIARFKRPKDYVFVPALPKNNYGKILKTELRTLDARRDRP